MVTEEIKALALEMGFDQVGITRVQDLKAGDAAVEAWVDQGLHGSMKYLEDFRQRRDKFFEEFGAARSVIVLGVNYFSQKNNVSPHDGAGLIGRVARYAWGRDYHEVIRQRHEEFLKRLRKIADNDFKAVSCIDIQPLPERFAAMKAGFGFVGKHTGILSQEFGPWLFLSEIVTDLDLEVSLPAAGDCGTCTHCQVVCPTGALDRDYNIDARLCIAYLTIEHKGVIARELRPKIKDWVFGCDECMEVCPFTSQQKQTKWPEFLPESGKGNHLALGSLFSLETNKRYEAEFKDSAMSRARRKQMLRNACIVLGNSGSESAVPFLEKGLMDKSALVRLHAAWGLGRLKQFKAARAALLVRQSQEKDAEVLQEIELALN